MADLIALAISGCALLVSAAGGKRAGDHDVADAAHWQGRMEEKLNGIAQNTRHVRDDIQTLNAKFDDLSTRVTSAEHKIEAHDKQIDGIWDQMRSDAMQVLAPLFEKGKSDD